MTLQDYTIQLRQNTLLEFQFRNLKMKHMGLYYWFSASTNSTNKQLQCIKLLLLLSDAEFQILSQNSCRVTFVYTFMPIK